FRPDRHESAREAPSARLGGDGGALLGSLGSVQRAQTALHHSGPTSAHGTELTVNAHGDGGRVLARSVGCQRGIDRLMSVERAEAQTIVTCHIRRHTMFACAFSLVGCSRRASSQSSAWNFSGGRL